MLTLDFGGLQWKKLDFHFHTPGSTDDYENLSVTPADIIAAVQEAGLDGFAVTDHNTGQWIDGLKQAAEERGIIIFPGVEVTVMGGERNVHILAIFDPSKGTAHVHDFLAQIGITEEKRGKTDILAEGDVNQIIDKISANDGLPLLAHCDSASVVTEEMRGQARISVVRNLRLLGAEITKDETASFFDGNDPDYKRKLAVFQASDCHSIAQIGRRSTYYKLGTMTARALRQCFYDPDTRIRILDHPSVQYPTILKMEVSSGFFDGVTFSFHSGLNAILGGKGVGKSLVVEYLRFVFGQPSDVPDIVRDFNSKLDKQLGLGGSVTIECQMPSGSRYRIRRTYDGVVNPAEAIELSTGTAYEGDVAKLMPILAYSQNEVIDISRNSDIQLMLIDRLVDVASYHRAIESIKEELNTNTNSYIEALSARERVTSLNQEIATLDAKVKELDTVLSHGMFDQKRGWDRRLLLMEQIKQAADKTGDDLRVVLESHDQAKLPPLADDDTSDTDLSSYHSKVTQARKTLLDDMKSALSQFETSLESSQDVRETWETKRQKWEEMFDKFLEEAGGAQGALSPSVASS